MKEWNTPVIEELSLSSTECYWVDTHEEESAVEYEFDCWTCHNAYWAGSGQSNEEAKKEQERKEQKYWVGGWGRPNP